MRGRILECVCVCMKGEHAQTGTRDIPSPAATRSLHLPHSGRRAHFSSAREADRRCWGARARTCTNTNAQHTTHPLQHKQGFDWFLAFLGRDEKTGKEFTEGSLVER